MTLLTALVVLVGRVLSLFLSCRAFRSHTLLASTVEASFCYILHPVPVMRIGERSSSATALVGLPKPAWSLGRLVVRVEVPDLSILLLILRLCPSRIDLVVQEVLHPPQKYVVVVVDALGRWCCVDLGESIE